MNEEDLPQKITRRGFFFQNFQGLSISSSGEKIWGVYLSNDVRKIKKLIMYDFKTNQELLYNFEFNLFISTVNAIEDLNLLVCSGWNTKLLFFNLMTGQVRKTIKLNYSMVCSSLKIQNVMAIGKKNKIFFIDLIKGEIIKDLEILIEGLWIHRMKIAVKNKKLEQNVLFACGAYSNEIKQIFFSESIFLKRLNLKDKRF